MTPPVEASPLLDIARLTVSRGDDTVFSNLTFAVQRGTLHALVGPNGAGKTTLLSAILGQSMFTGRITANWAHSGRIGYVPQVFHVDRSLPVTVADFLALSRQQKPVCFGVTATAAARVRQLLDRVGLAGFGHRSLSVLSGGELRRVLIANALDPLPELLLLDEPASGLDESGARWLNDTLVSLKGQSTILMVSHDTDQVRRIADAVTSVERPHSA
jgi:zinc transport system ATP-binding protein